MKKATKEIVARIGFIKDRKDITDESGLMGIKWCWGEVMIPASYDAIKHSINRTEDANKYMSYPKKFNV